MTKIFVWIISIVLFVLLLVFALNNLDPVTLKLAGSMQWQLPMVVLVLVVFAIGCGVGMFAMLPFAWRVRRQAKKESKKLIEQAAERAALSSSVTGTPNVLNVPNVPSGANGAPGVASGVASSNAVSVRPSET